MLAIFWPTFRVIIRSVSVSVNVGERSNYIVKSDI